MDAVALAPRDSSYPSTLGAGGFAGYGKCTAVHVPTLGAYSSFMCSHLWCVCVTYVMILCPTDLAARW